MTRTAAVVLSLLSACSCNSPLSNTENHSGDAEAGPAPSLPVTVPEAGTVVDSLVQKIEHDPLNKREFKVRILATNSSATGLYNLELTYGYNFNSTEIVLPAWTDGVILLPQIRAAEEPYQCFIGFDAGDGVFRELYKVSNDNGTLRLRQTMSYAIEQP